MKMRYKLSLLVVAFLLAISMTVGTSYAFWNATIYQEETNDVTTGCLEIEVNDLDVDGNSTSINLPNTYPMSDTMGLYTTPYTLTIKNTCSLNAEYTILFNTLSSSSLNESHVKYQMIKTLPNVTNMKPVILNTLSTTSLDPSIATDLNSSFGKNVLNTYAIGNGVLNAMTDTTTDSVTYELRLWIDESVGYDVMGSTFEAAVSVYAEATK